MEKGIRLIGNGQGKPRPTSACGGTCGTSFEFLRASFSSSALVLERNPQRVHHPWKVRPDVHDHPPGPARGYGQIVSGVRQARAWCHQSICRDSRFVPSHGWVPQDESCGRLGPRRPCCAISLRRSVILFECEAKGVLFWLYIRT
jgi:hypothetical protein